MYFFSELATLGLITFAGWWWLLLLFVVTIPTFCPYKGFCSYYNVGDAPQVAWSYRHAYAEVGGISDFVSFEPDIVSVQLDGIPIHLEPGQTVIPHGPDRNLTVAQALPRQDP
jgi:hypothetical protein